MITLNVNIDHVATVRNARGGAEPDPVSAAIIAELAGASGIVCHLREDRRHINDRDLDLLKQVNQSKLDLEMSANSEIIKIALDILPDLVTIVPENRMELTTEGGLNLNSDINKFKKLVKQMHDKGIEVSFFIEPEISQIDLAVKIKADMVEFHTGIYANAKSDYDITNQYEKLYVSAEHAHINGLKIAAGHGLNYFNVKKICSIPFINELSIGHSIISRAIFSGVDSAVREMISLINYSVLEANQ